MRSALLGCFVLAAASLGLHAAPSYDAWAWIIWGREIAGLDLNTVDGPSWKPLPVMLTSVFALVREEWAPALWLLAARAGALLGVVMAYRIAARFAGRTAGAVAAVALLLSFGYLRYARHGASEGLLAALILWALERHLEGRRDHAFGLGVLAALLRPEAWPFLALYGLWLWWAEPRLRRLAAAAAVLVIALWLGPELAASGDALRASTRAREPMPNSPAFADRPALTVLGKGEAMLVWSVNVAALAGLVAAARSWRRGADRALLLLAGGALGWLGLVAVMAEFGYAGNPRYLVPISAVGAVLAGVGVVRVGHAAGDLAGRLGARGSLVRPALVAALTLALLPAAWPRVTALQSHPRLARAEVEQQGTLPLAIARAGGRDRVRACGRAYTSLYEVPVLAWNLRMHLDEVTYLPTRPGTVFRTRPAAGGPPEPLLSAGGPRYRPVAAVGRWDVLAACQVPGRARLAARGD